MAGTPLAQRIESLIAPSISDMGYDLVRVQIGGGRRSVLQIMAERVDRRPMTVEDCADISHAVSAILDVDDPISGAYTLEVSSPGIDRPLVRPDDYRRFAGHEAKVELEQPVEGRRRFRGRIAEAAEDRVTLATEDGEVDLPFAHIAKAKLVLTDELIAASEQQESE